MFLAPTPRLVASGGVKSVAGFDQNHTAFDVLLKRYVHDGRVDYKGFKASEGELDLYLKQLADVKPEQLSAWSDDEKLAFWINAYNAFTIKAILDNYPIRGGVLSIYPSNSIRQIDGVWDKLEFEAAGKPVTLNQIEHGILRKEFKEPRIHFAIVCASVGCPLLKNESFKADEIRKQLDERARAFVNDPDKVMLKPGKDEVALSRIFKWFGGDFVPKFGNTGDFKRNNPKERAALNFVKAHLLDGAEFDKFPKTRRIRVTYLPYDWSLNEQTHP